MIEQHTLKVLEWEKLLQNLAGYAGSEVGKELCLNLQFVTDPDKLHILHTQTAEAKYLLEAEGSIPLGGIRNIAESLGQAQKGRTLSSQKLLAISDTLMAGRVLKNFLNTKSEKCPELWCMVSPIVSNKELEADINSCFNKDGNIKDTASIKLSEIRAKIKHLQRGIRQKLVKFVKNPEYKHFVHDDLISQRNERYVISLKAGCQSHISGIIHDQSASGATFYFEPMIILHENNELRQQFIEEQKEIEKILLELTNKVREHLPSLYILINILAEIDCVTAKAHYSLSIKANRPVLNNNGVISLKKVRHPLLIKRLGWDKVVPIDIELGSKFNSLIITGPNTGGKTVTLKTLGLCALMVKIGLQIPAASDSELGNFKKILADIGDEQSIEQNLSTFSGHISNIINILQKADSNSLVLIDEIGTGTDPEEGIVLSRAILEELYEKGCKIAVTTHFGELKAMAFQQKGIENAAVEFDVKTLQPTYRVLMGLPGSSNALIIASHLGLPDYIIDRSKELMGKEKQDITSAIEKLENMRKKLEDETDELSIKIENLERIKEEYNQKKQQLESDRQKFIEKSRKQLADDIEDARNNIAQIIRDLQQGKSSAQKAHKATQALKSIESNYLKSEKGLKPVSIEEHFKIGQKVYLPKLSLKGEILSLPDNNDNVQILCDNFKMSVKLDELEPSSDIFELKDKFKIESSGINIKCIKRKTVNECDLRGMLVEDALREAENFLAQSYGTMFSNVYIIHGKGTGALRKAIHAYLKECSYIKSFRLGESNEGGSGITVVTLNN